MMKNLRSAAGMATIWAVAVAGVSATAWLAIDRAGRDITSASVSSLVATPQTTTPLTTPPLTTAATAVRPTDTTPRPIPRSTPAPSVASPPSEDSSAPATPSPRESPRRSNPPRTSTPQPPQTSQVRSVTVQGGHVTVRCTGTRIQLQVAQPENGWRVEVEDSESGRAVVSFQTSGEEEGQQIGVTAVCSRGVPKFVVSTEQED